MLVCMYSTCLILHVCQPYVVTLFVFKAKDYGNISDLAFHELKLVPAANLPSINQIWKERSQQNGVIPINEVTNIYF